MPVAARPANSVASALGSEPEIGLKEHLARATDARDFMTKDPRL